MDVFPDGYTETSFEGTARRYWYFASVYHQKLLVTLPYVAGFAAFIGWMYGVLNVRTVPMIGLWVFFLVVLIALVGGYAAFLELGRNQHLLELEAGNAAFERRREAGQRAINEARDAAQNKNFAAGYDLHGQLARDFAEERQIVTLGAQPLTKEEVDTTLQRNSEPGEFERELRQILSSS